MIKKTKFAGQSLESPTSRQSFSKSRHRLWLQAFYLSLQPTPACLAQVFKDGYPTEWTMQSLLFTSALMTNFSRTCQRINRDAASDIYQRISIPRNLQNVLSRIRPQPTAICGYPAPEIDGAWDKLLAGMFKISIWRVGGC